VCAVTTGELKYDKKNKKPRPAGSLNEYERGDQAIRSGTSTVITQGWPAISTGHDRRAGRLYEH